MFVGAVRQGAIQHDALEDGLLAVLGSVADTAVDVPFAPKLVRHAMLHSHLCGHIRVRRNFVWQCLTICTNPMDDEFHY